MTTLPMGLLSTATPDCEALLRRPVVTTLKVVDGAFVSNE